MTNTKNCGDCNVLKQVDAFTTAQWAVTDDLTRTCVDCETIRANSNGTGLAQPADAGIRTSEQPMMAQQLLLLQEMTKNQTTLTAILNNKQDKDQDYIKLNYHSEQIGKFKGRFPSNHKEFYQWSYMIKEFLTKFSGLGCSPETLFHKVIATVTGNTNVEWEQYRAARYQEYIAADLTRVISPESQKEFNKTVDTIDELIKFTVKKVMVRPDITYFRRLFQTFKCLERETPKNTLTRFQAYLFQYESLRLELNPNLDFQLRHFTPRDKVDMLRRIFIEDNVNISYLNEKVRTKLTTKWLALEKVHITALHSEAEYGNMLSALNEYIGTQLTQIVLPILDNPGMDESKRWKQHVVNTSLFKLEPKGQQDTGQRGRKRKRNDKTDTNGSPKKRRKEWKDPCRNGKTCKFGRKCMFFHPNSHFKTKDAKPASVGRRREKCANHARGFPCARNPCPHDHPPPSKRTGDRSRTRNPIQRNERTPCSLGVKCWKWQKGDCSNGHDARKMTCKTCGKMGHGSSRCFQNPNSTPRYNPNRPNHPAIRAHDANTLVAKIDEMVGHFADVHERLDGIGQTVQEMTSRGLQSAPPNQLSLQTKSKRKLDKIQSALNSLRAENA